MGHNQGKFQLIKYLSVANSWLKVVEEFILSSSVFIMASLLILNVIARNFFKPIYFVEEVTTFLVILVTFVGLGYGARRARHVRMSALFDLAPPKIQKILMYFSSLLGLAVMVFLGFAAIEYVQNLKDMKQLTPIFSVPYWKFVFIAPIGFFISALRYLIVGIRNMFSQDVWVGSDTVSEYDEDSSIEDQIGI